MALWISGSSSMTRMRECPMAYHLFRMVSCQDAEIHRDIPYR